MLVLIVEPQKKPEISEITGTLEEMQSIVGGYIQALYPFPEEVALICNDDGKLLHLPPNRGLRTEDGELYDILCGTFFLCAAPADSENFASLTLEQAEKYERCFHTPEMFIGMDGRIVCLPME